MASQEWCRWMRTQLLYISRAVVTRLGNCMRRRLHWSQTLPTHTLTMVDFLPSQCVCKVTTQPVVCVLHCQVNSCTEWVSWLLQLLSFMRQLTLLLTTLTLPTMQATITGVWGAWSVVNVLWCHCWCREAKMYEDAESYYRRAAKLNPKVQEIRDTVWSERFYSCRLYGPAHSPLARGRWAGPSNFLLCS